MVEAKFVEDHFVCGTCGADLGFMRLGPSNHNIDVVGAQIQGTCGHANTVTKFHKD